MDEQQTTEMNTLKKQVDGLWDDIVALNNDIAALDDAVISLGKEYLSFYEDAFLSGESNGRTRIKELYRQEEMPF